MADSEESLIRAFCDRFQKEQGFETIVEARKFASSVLQQSISSGTAEAKWIEECIERSLVRVAREIVQAHEPLNAYERLVELYQAQPVLGTRTSTSVLQQAYSTPLPIAFLASALAGIRSKTTVYEPTAGNGALLFAVDPENATVNELNPNRARDLQHQGYRVTNKDATLYLPEQLHDVVILNPPFNSILEGGKPKRFQTGAYVTTQIDHAIALHALKAMKPDGKAVLILGGKLTKDEDRRSNRYHSRESRAFYYTLYNTYNVTQHLSISGHLYRKQGANFPIDLIVINGQGKSERGLPAADVPKIYDSFNSLKEVLYDALLQQQKTLDSSYRPSSIASPSNSSSSRESERSRDLGRLSRTSLSSSGMDDSAGIGSRASLPNDSPLSRRGAYGSSDLESARPRGRSAGLGASDRDRQPGIPGAPVNSMRVELPSTSHQISRSLGHDSTNFSGGMATKHDLSTDRGLAPIDAPNQENRIMADSAIKQVPYTPHSAGNRAGTLVPVNMQAATSNALGRLAQQVDSIDTYVAQKLAYASTEELHRYLTAEQIDAIALAIHNIEEGSGFILGDQTGVGKGRVVASLIRYAKLSGKIPIFVTKKPDLYADMMRDLADIDFRSFNPFITNESIRIPLVNGGQIRTGSSTHRQELQVISASGNLGNYDGIFTTYYQLQAVSDKEPERRSLLRRFAPSSILLLDESHMAGGSINNQSSKVANRADFTRELIDQAQGVLYSSATYAKNPEVMTLYRKTNMRLAVGHIETLVSLIQKMGVPGQQALATMLTEEGQYIRRERSYEGISFTADVVPVDRNTAEQVAEIMSSIMEFDRTKQLAVKDMNKQLKREAKALKLDTSIGEAGAKSIEFASIMHNLIDQMLLSLKAEATVERSLTLLSQGEKPVITVANTMGSFIGNYASAQGIQVGDALNLDFGAMLARYLERSREVILKDAYGNRQFNATRSDGQPCYRLTNEELGWAGVEAFEETLAMIEATDFSNLPISPIDYIESRLQAAGYRVNEVTGREHQVEYTTDGGQYYQVRSQADRSTRASIENVRAFNRGDIDVMILNQAGSTGISLHASETFADQRPRHMIIAQAERNIDDFMQMLGRIHRYGQVVPPSYTLLCADIPAEKRPGAVLAKKMASLNANTTAARSSEISLNNVPDFMNEYGDAVVSEIMLNHPALHIRLGTPLKFLDEGDEPEAAIRKVTGRIPLLPIAEQEALYDRIEREYAEFVERQESIGESILEAQSLDLDARIIGRMEVMEADATLPSQFTSPVYLEVVDVKTLRKPLTTLEVINVVHRELNLAELTEADDLEAVQENIKVISTNRTQAQISALRQSTESYRQQYESQFEQQLASDDTPTRLKAAHAIEKFNTRLDRQLNHVSQLLELYSSGTPVRILTATENAFYGVAARIWQMDGTGNPTAPANWKIQFLLASAAKELTLPLSQVNLSGSNALFVSRQAKDLLDTPVYELFDQRQTKNRQERQIFTGNVLRAMEKFNGKLINYTNEDGKVCQGVLTPDDFDIEQVLESEPVAMPSPQEAIQFLFEGSDRKGQLKTPDKGLILKAQRKRQGDGIVLQTARSRAEGGEYFLDKALMALAEAEFISTGDAMTLTVLPERITSIVAYLYEEKGLKLIAFEQRHKAREMLGIVLPQMQKVEQRKTEPIVIQPIESSQLQNDLGLHHHEQTATTIQNDEEMEQGRLFDSVDFSPSLDPTWQTKLSVPISSTADLLPTTTELSATAHLDSNSSQQTLIDGLNQIPATWALTPVDGEKAPYRSGWQTEPPLSKAELIQEIEQGAKGYALRLGQVSGGIVAIDLDGASAQVKLLELSGGAALPETISFTSGRPGRSQHLFQIPQKFWSQIKSRKFSTGVKGDDGKGELVELRWQGLLSVLPPSAHPTTGQYQWLLSPEKSEIAIAPSWMIEQMVIQTTQTHEPVAHTPQASTHHNHWSDRDWAMSYLAALHPERADDRGMWLKVGMALHSADPMLLAEWDRWSAQSAKYKPGECEYVWNRLHENGGVTLGTLGAWAREDGWQSPSEKADKQEIIAGSRSVAKRAESQSHQSSNDSSQAQSPTNPLMPCLLDFRRWYFYARETGRSQPYLDRIQILAEDFKAKTPESQSDSTIRNSDVKLSDSAIAHMKIDADNYGAMVEQFAKDAKTIVKYKGESTTFDEQSIYQYCSPVADYRVRYYCQSQKLTVEKAGHVLLDQRSQNAEKSLVTREDMQRFRQEAVRLRQQAREIPPQGKSALEL